MVATATTNLPWNALSPLRPLRGFVDATISFPDQNGPKLGRGLSTFTYRDEQETLKVNYSHKLDCLLTFETISRLMLRQISSRGHELSRVVLDVLITHII
jgi:hypothetical protein